MIERPPTTSNNGNEYKNWQFVKTRSRLLKHNLQIPRNNRFFLLEEPVEDWNERNIPQ